MAPNRIVHQLLTGRKRKAPTTGVSSRAIASRHVIENNRSATENIRTKRRSSTFPPTLVPKPSVDKQHTEPRDRASSISQSALIGSPSKNRTQQCNTQSLALGAQLSVATKEVGTKSFIAPRPSILFMEANPETLTKSVATCPDRRANQEQQLEEQPRKRASQNQQPISSRYRRRHREKQNHLFKNSIGIKIGETSVDANRKRDGMKSNRTKYLLSTRQRRGRPSTKLDSLRHPLPRVTKDDNDAYAEQLVRTFLEQRLDRRFISPNTVLSSTSTTHSLLDDQALLPVFLLGVCALSHVFEWYDRKKKETHFAQSQLVRELVLWMRSRQEVQAAYTSESIVRKHVDALNQLAKFQESIESCHQTSLELSSQQREEDLLCKERRYDHKQTNFDARNTSRRKSAPHRFGSNEKEEVNAKGFAIAESSYIHLKEKDAVEVYDQGKQDMYLDQSQVGQVAEKSKLDLTESTQDNTLRRTKTVGIEKTLEKLDVSSKDGTQDEILPSLGQSSSVRDKNLPSVPMFRDNMDCAADQNNPTHNSSLLLKSPNSSVQKKSERVMTKSITGVDEGENRISDVEREIQQPILHDVNESKNDGAAYEGDCWNSMNSDSLSDDMSEVLLSQSRNKLPRSRRVTTSPRTFTEESAQKSIERYAHYTQIDFAGRQQATDEKKSGIYFDGPLEKMKDAKRSNRLKRSSSRPLDKGWVSRAAKRSPIFKQTLMMPSGGWVSNLGARNFVKNERSPRKSAPVQTNPMPGVASREGDSTSENGDSDIREDDGQERTPLANVTIVPNNGIVSPTSKITNAERTIAGKIPTTGLPSYNKQSAFKQQNNDAQRHALDVSDKINNGDISGMGNSFEKSDEIVNNYPYEEVVRGKTAREALIGYECKECAAFFDKAVLHGDGANHYNRDELLRCSRHRARQTPPQTPEDFWDLSFMDEKLERKEKESTKTKFSFSER